MSDNDWKQSVAAIGGAIVITLLMLSNTALAQSSIAPSAAIGEDGTVHAPAMAVPVSEYLTPEGKAYLVEHLMGVAGQGPQRPPKDGLPGFLAGYLDRAKALFPVDVKDTKIAGVHVYVFTPKSGVSAENQHRVLIDLHGGGFATCWPGCGELESLPISSLGKIKVVSVDYREGPKYRFPAASEDVATVYADLLRTYRPENIGIYGCSAGGMLTGMATAWFQKHNLPRPGAIGIFCAGLTLQDGKIGGGDSMHTVLPIGEARISFPALPSSGDYLSGADTNDPLVAPAVSPAVLAQFPPTLFITGTRGMELSSAVYSHSLLVKAGVDAELHVWEGMFHGFFYNPDVPESRDCYNVILKFFGRHLGH